MVLAGQTEGLSLSAKVGEPGQAESARRLLRLSAILVRPYHSAESFLPGLHWLRRCLLEYMSRLIDGREGRREALRGGLVTAEHAVYARLTSRLNLIYTVQQPDRAVFLQLAARSGGEPPEAT